MHKQSDNNVPAIEMQFCIDLCFFYYIQWISKIAFILIWTLHIKKALSMKSNWQTKDVTNLLFICLLYPFFDKYILNKKQLLWFHLFDKKVDLHMDFARILIRNSHPQKSCNQINIDNFLYIERLKPQKNEIILVSYWFHI